MAYIHSFESMAAVDGKGLRYAVFLTGCPLRCVYCHNPDTWQTGGQDYSAVEIFNKVKRYKPYFKNGGGVTFSGGEPLLSASFINEIYPLLKDEGIGYCLDTSGSVDLTDEVKTALINADLVILDIKFYSPEHYKKYCGGDFNKFLEIGRFCTKNNIPLWLRTVIVPGINDNKSDIDKYIELTKEFNFEKYELLAFHTMGFFKYDKLNIANPLASCPPLDFNKLTELQTYLDSKLKKRT